MIPIYRVQDLVCMACGREQRCRHQIVSSIAGDVEILDTCSNCQRSDSWQNLPKIRITEQQMMAEYRLGQIERGEVILTEFGYMYVGPNQ